MRSLIYLADIDTHTIPGTAGTKQQYVKKMTAVTAEVLVVGQNTYWQAQSTNNTLSLTFLIRKDLYNTEKYIYSCGKLYEVVNQGKAKDGRDLLINVKDLKNTEIEKVIKEWIDATETLCTV